MLKDFIFPLIIFDIFVVILILAMVLCFGNKLDEVVSSLKDKNIKDYNHENNIEIEEKKEALDSWILIGLFIPIYNLKYALLIMYTVAMPTEKIIDKWGKADKEEGSGDYE